MAPPRRHALDAEAAARGWHLKTANVVLHRSPYYRLEVFTAGLQAHGYRVISDRNAQPDSSDVLLIWNRNPNHERIAKRYEEAGATVLVTENGFIGKTKAIAKFHHAGAGEWHVGTEDRWSRLNVDVKAWRTDGRHILLLPQRSIGEPGVAMPRNWEQSTLNRLRRMTDRPIRVRKHPGKNPKTPVEDELRGAWAAVTWASGAGIKAICAGIPVFHDLKNWIGAPAASCAFDIENPYLGDRSAMFHRLAWAQWSWSEIESGTAFGYLLGGGTLGNGVLYNCLDARADAPEKMADKVNNEVTP